MLQFIQEHTWFFLLIINYVIALATAVFVILHNRSPAKTLSFILVLLVLPFVGVFIYYFFGQEYRKSKIFKREDVYGHKRIKEWEQKLLLDEAELDDLEKSKIGKKSKIIRLLQNNQRNPITFRNNVKILLNAEMKYHFLFEDLKEAKDHIHLEYYIFNDDNIGRRVIDMLCLKSSEGVAVKVCYDYVGSRMGKKSLKKMKSAGVEVKAFMPVWFPNLTRKLNYRNHRKMVIIDGNIGYVGGINICDSYTNCNDSKSFWRDTHCRIEGHAVKSLQTQFLYSWDFLTIEEFEIREEYYPKTRVDRNIAVQIAASGPDTNFPNIMEAILVAINSAEDYIYITTPYFIPNEEILTAMCTASRSGVKVKLIVPEKGDSFAARYATNSYISQLLESGVEVYHYCKGMVHAKTMVVDGNFATVGTCNMDNRSFNLNFEVNAMFFDEEIGQVLYDYFDQDIMECTAIKLEEWKNRHHIEKVKESFFRLWAPLL